MASVTRSIVIEAPVEAVFAYMEDPTHQPDISSDAATIQSVEPLPEGGMKSRYTYDVAGMTMEGEIQTIDYVANQHIKFAISGGLDGTLFWQFESLGDNKTQMTYTGDYEVDIPLLGGAIASAAAQFNAQEIETQLSNLKQIMESKNTEEMT